MMQTDDGVSPVIATILLIAVTVTLVTIISAVLMGMVGGFDSSVKDVDVMLRSDDSGRGVMVTILEGKDAGSLRNFAVNVEGYDSMGFVGSYSGSPQIGTPYKFGFNIPAGTKFTGTVTVTGEFNDGTKVLLAKRDLTFSGSD